MFTAIILSPSDFLLLPFTLPIKLISDPGFFFAWAKFIFFSCMKNRSDIFFGMGEFYLDAGFGHSKKHGLPNTPPFHTTHIVLFR